MDVNQTRFKLVYGQADWLPVASGRSPSAEPLFDWNASDATLSLHQQLFVFPKLTGQVPLDVTNRRGSGRDCYGNWYWIAESQIELRFLSMKTGSSAQHFWAGSDAVTSCVSTGEFVTSTTPQPSAALVFSGLAVTADHYLVVGVTQPKGLLVFDLYSGGPPAQLLWPATVPFEPFDMAVANDGGVLILDRVNLAYWKLDRNLLVQNFGPSAASAATSGFQPVVGNSSGVGSEEQSCVPSQVTLNFAAPLTAVSDPVAIESLEDGSVLILDNPTGGYCSIVHRFQAGVEIGPPVSLAQALASYVPTPASADDPYPRAVRGYDFAFTAKTSLPNAVGTLYIAQIYGDQSFAFDVAIAGNNLSLNAQPRYFPMRQFEGKGLESAGGCVYYDFQELWFQLAEQPRPQYQSQAQLLLPQPSAANSPASPPLAFDGKLPGCVWHRIFLDACIPPGAVLLVESRAAEVQSLLPSTPWQTEPQPYLRANGCEIPYVTPQLQGLPDRTGTWELLFQNAVGRYLQLRLTLSGNGRNTPRLQALRAYYPRFSYLRQYLPAVYQEDPVSTSFLDRYLANVEGFYTVLEGKIAQVQELFDPRIIPAEYLDWLASWMSIVLDPTWSEQTRRLVLAHAPQMFFERGTPNGIIRAITLMLDPCSDESLFAESASISSSCSRSSSASNSNSCSCSGSSPAGQISDVYPVRLVENFLTRSSPMLNSSDVTDVKAPGVVASGAVSGAAGSAWTPAQGAAPLNALFVCYLQSEYGTVAALNAAWGKSYTVSDDPTLVLPPVQPTGTTQAADWKRFLRDGLGFTYAAVTSADQTSYQAFLAQQYNAIGDLNTAWGLTGTNLYSSFASVLSPNLHADRRRDAFGLDQVCLGGSSYSAKCAPLYGDGASESHRHRGHAADEAGRGATGRQHRKASAHVLRCEVVLGDVLRRRSPTRRGHLDRLRQPVCRPGARQRSTLRRQPHRPRPHPSEGPKKTRANIHCRELLRTQTSGEVRMSTFQSGAPCMQKLDPQKRVNYTYGMVLGVDEFSQEQLYLMAKDHSQYRLAHGYGTVCGSDVAISTAPVLEVQVSKGVAINPRGQQIHVQQVMCARLNDWLVTNQTALQNIFGNPPLTLSLCVVLCYRECPTDSVPVPGEPCRTQQDTMAASRIADSFQLKLCLNEDQITSSPPGSPAIDAALLDGLCFRPSQVEEDTIRRFGRLLHRIRVGDYSSSVTEDELKDLVRQLENDSGTVTSPLTSPPEADSLIYLSTHDAPEFLRAAFLVWVTEVRPTLVAKSGTCGCGCPDEKCVLLAELAFQVSKIWQVVGPVAVDESRRPICSMTRVLQEWLLNQVGGDVASGTNAGSSPLWLQECLVSRSVPLPIPWRSPRARLSTIWLRFPGPRPCSFTSIGAGRRHTWNRRPVRLPLPTS